MDKFTSKGQRILFEGYWLHGEFRAIDDGIGYTLTFFDRRTFEMNHRGYAYRVGAIFDMREEIENNLTNSQITFNFSDSSFMGA